jgi:uncharacterized membrane protein (DUF485 family)
MTHSQLATLSRRVSRLERIVVILKAIYSVRYSSELDRLQAELKEETGGNT